MIDLHSHVLPGVDDGARTPAESLEIARAAAAEGVTALAATPHVRDDYPTDAATMERLVEETRVALREAGVALELLPGGELDLRQLRRLDDDELRRFGLAGTDWLLLETPYFGWPLDLGEVVFRLAARGFRAILAHPERNADVQARPELLRPLVEGGLLVQLTAASVDGRLGRRSQACARRLLELELAHLIASDAHAAAIREIGMSAAAAAVGDGDLARWLTQDVPQAIVAAERLPDRPERRRRSRLPWR